MRSARGPQVVRDDVKSWNEKMYLEREAHLERNKAIRDTIMHIERQHPEREAVVALKKKLGSQVRVEVLQLETERKAYKDGVLASNCEQAARIRAETTVEGTDAARKFMFEQRRESAEQTRVIVQAWEVERRTKQHEFRIEAQHRKDKSRKIESTARLSRKALQEKKRQQAHELRERKQQQARKRNENEAAHAAMVKSVVNLTVADKFAMPAHSRRMLAHPHYQEVGPSAAGLASCPPAVSIAAQPSRPPRVCPACAQVAAVLSDPSSSISKEIASSPRRKPPPNAARALRSSSAGALPIRHKT